jgi:hypothetical protein
MADVWFAGLLQILPVADAGLDQSVSEFDLATLDGSNSSDPDDDPLFYQWEQVGGTVVVLSDPTSERPTFTAPEVDAHQKWTKIPHSLSS